MSLEKQTDSRTKDLWSIVLIELTSHCNFSCSFCPIEKVSRDKTMMPKALWEKILQELADKKMAHTIFLHVLGEPLIHKDILDAVRFANNRDLSVSLYTNGALLDQKRSAQILDVLKKGRVVLSLQEITSESFHARCRGTISWQQYINRLLTFVQLNETRKNSIPIQIHCMLDMQGLGWNLPQIRSEQKKIQAVYNQWQKALGIQNGKKINIFNPTAVYPLNENASFFVKHAGNWDNKLLADNLQVVESEVGHCALMTDTFAVLSDGTCTYCCNDYEGELNLGNAFERSLEDIFYGPKAVAIRQAEKQGKFIAQRCKICRGTLVFKKNQKPVPTRNIMTDCYIFWEHLKRYGLKSATRKIVEVAQKRPCI